MIAPIEPIGIVVTARAVRMVSSCVHTTSRTCLCLPIYRNPSLFVSLSESAAEGNRSHMSTDCRESCLSTSGFMCADFKTSLDEMNAGSLISKKYCTQSHRTRTHTKPEASAVSTQSQKYETTESLEHTSKCQAHKHTRQIFTVDTGENKRYVPLCTPSKERNRHTIVAMKGWYD